MREVNPVFIAAVVITLAGGGYFWWRHTHPEPAPDEQLWRALRAFFGFVGAHRDGWAVLYRQARASVSFAAELTEMRRRVVDVVIAMLTRVVAGQGLPVRETELAASAYALVGAGESLADWLADHPAEDPERVATRMMNLVWLGAGQLLRGDAWRPSS